MLTDLEFYDEEVAYEELDNVGSFNHSYLQSRLTILLWQKSSLTVLTELSLDVSGLQDETLRRWFREEIKPDVAVYDKRKPDYQDDIIRMVEMPILAVEILSPTQATMNVLRKVKAYFALGVQSCWLVYPYSKTVTVYRAADDYQSYSSGELVDSALNITIPLSEIF